MIIYNCFIPRADLNDFRVFMEQNARHFQRLYPNSPLVAVGDLHISSEQVQIGTLISGSGEQEYRSFSRNPLSLGHAWSSPFSTQKFHLKSFQNRFPSPDLILNFWCMGVLSSQKRCCLKSFCKIFPVWPPNVFQKGRNFIKQRLLYHVANLWKCHQKFNSIYSFIQFDKLNLGCGEALCNSGPQL